MFNGIIFNTGKVINLKKNKHSIHIGIQTTINFNIYRVLYTKLISENYVTKKTLHF